MQWNMLYTILYVCVSPTLHRVSLMENLRQSRHFNGPPFLCLSLNGLAFSFSALEIPIGTGIHSHTLLCHYFFTSILHDAFYAHFTRAFYILLNK